MVVVDQTPPQRALQFQRRQPHPMRVAHRQNVGEIAMHFAQSQQRLQRLRDPGAMREHVQVGIGAGLRRPIVQRLDATPADVLLRFCAILELAAAELGP